MYVGCKFTLKRHITVLGCKISTAGLLLDRLYFTADKSLAVGFLDPPGEAHLGSIGKDRIAPVIRAFWVVAFVVDEQAEGVGLWCVVHGFLFRVDAKIDFILVAIIVDFFNQFNLMLTINTRLKTVRLIFKFF